jgi:hypothetical protein
MESSTFMYNWKSIKEFEQGESKSKGCKACTTWIIFNDVEVKQEGQKP